MQSTTFEFLKMLDKHCQKADVSCPQGLCDGINASMQKSKEEVEPLANVFALLPL